MMNILEDLKLCWKSIVFILTPFVFLPLVTVLDSEEAKAGYGLIVMAIYWMFDIIPLAVTALLPVVIFPLIGSMSVSELASNYFKNVNMLMLGGLMIAVSFERSNLHKRIAMRVLMVVGTKPRWVMLGFMLPTWFLSMWISNTATTSMMVPVAEAVLEQLKKKETGDGKTLDNCDSKSMEHGFTNMALEEDTAETRLEELKIEKNEKNGEAEKETLPELAYGRSESVTVKTNETQTSEKDFKESCKAMCLCVAYAANIGGIATLTGTPPNLVLQSVADDIFKAHGMESNVSWTTWIMFGLPVSAIILVLAWLWISLIFLGPRAFCKCSDDEESKRQQKKAKDVLQLEYNKLGPMTFAEIANMIAFIIVVILWFTRSPGFFTGWGSLFKPGFPSDTTSAFLVATFLFSLPYTWERSSCCLPEGTKPKRAERLLDWETVTVRLPWNVVLLLGGGFALAEVCAKSGLSSLFAKQLEVLKDIPGWALILIVCLLIAGFTEIATNTTTTVLFLPILGELAESLGMNPIFIMLPATISASFAFMLPIATAPNAIVFSYGHLKVGDMVKVGFLMNITAIIVVNIFIQTLGVALFDLNEIPWATGNATMTTISTISNLP